MERGQLQRISVATALVLCLLLVVSIGYSLASDQDIASVNGKYYNLLKTLNVHGDQGSYGNFNDWGSSTTGSWGGYTNLPPGYWVYVYPNWYIWKDMR